MQQEENLMNGQSDRYATTSVAEETKVANDPIRVYLDVANRWDATTRELDGLVS